MTAVVAGCAVALSNLHFGWPDQPDLLTVDDFQLHRGERLFLHGPSGSGKTTLLNLLAGVLTPRSGEIQLLGAPFSSCSARQRDRIRADHLGFIFQVFNLLPYLSLLDNVLLPCRFSLLRRQRACERFGSEVEAARYLLATLELDHNGLLKRPVSQLSVGQQQRVAAVRALIGDPELIIADEPTSALDSDRRQAFIELLTAQVEHSQSALLFVSHDHSLKPYFQRAASLPEIAGQVG
ncbi:MAG: ABC transporter ATP-binding protein [Marinobacterium sp.]|nr:ABC transporter ATP-binding protein [Marinobacterium sp.]